MSWADTAARLTAETMPALGNDVTIGATSGKGILKSPSESVFDGVIVVTDWMLELPAGVWATVPEGLPVVVDGVTYVAREQSRPGVDGSTIHVPLERVTGDQDVILDGDWI